MGQIDEPDELHQYLTTFRQHKALVISVAALILGLMMLRSYMQEPVYQSQARVLVRLVNTGMSSVFNMQTESELVRSEPVAEVVADAIAFVGPPSSLLGGLSVAVSTETEILIVNYVSGDPQEAQVRAQAFADGYLTYRSNEVEKELSLRADQLAQQTASLNSRISELTERASETQSPAAKANLQTRVNGLVSQLAFLEQERTQIVSPGDVRVGDVVQPAALPSGPFSPNYTQNAIIGAFLGLIAGLGAALLRERLDDRLRGRHDFQSRLGHAVLAVIPKVSNWRRSKVARIVTLDEPHSIPAEAYKTLRTSTLFIASNQDAKVLLITGPHPQEGKTSTLSNLGVSLAQADRRVIIASADLRRPRLQEFFGLSNDVGITTLLSGETSLEETLRRVNVNKLRVLTSGPPPLNPAELLGSEAMGLLLDQLRGLADIVLLDSPPVLAVADALILAPLTDGVIFIADPSRSSRSSVSNAARQLEQVDARILGGVLNNVDLSDDTYGAYQGPYYGGSPYGTANSAPTSRFRLRRARA